MPVKAGIAAAFDSVFEYDDADNIELSYTSTCCTALSG
jgi:hypothetical protein